MAKHVYHTCDRCGKRLPDDYIPLRIDVDCRPDGAGDMVNTVEQLDLCQNCLVGAVNYLITERMPSFGDREEFVKWAGGKKT